MFVNCGSNSVYVASAEPLLILILRPCESVPLPGRRVFQNVAKDENLEMGDYPGLSGWSCLIRWVPAMMIKKSDT